MDQLSKNHKRLHKARKIPAIALPMLCIGLMACTSSNQEDSNTRSDEPLEIAIESADIPATNPFSKVSATVSSHTDAIKSDKVSEAMLSGAARQTVNYLANETGSDTSGTSWRCTTITTDDESNILSLSFNSDNSGMVNNTKMNWSVTTENILVIDVPRVGVVRLSGIKFDIDDGDVVQFSTIDDKAEQSSCIKE